MTQEQLAAVAEKAAYHYMLLRTYNIALRLTQISEDRIAAIERDGIAMLAATTTFEGTDPAVGDMLADEIVHAIAALQSDARKMREAAP